MPAGVSIPRTADDDFDEWREDMISKAEAELKAAMSAGDPERLKAAIANASATVAKARRKTNMRRDAAAVVRAGPDEGGMKQELPWQRALWRTCKKLQVNYK
jgi:hypothetical protein